MSHSLPLAPSRIGLRKGNAPFENHFFAWAISFLEGTCLYLGGSKLHTFLGNSQMTGFAVSLHRLDSYFEGKAQVKAGINGGCGCVPVEKQTLRNVNGQALEFSDILAVHLLLGRYFLSIGLNPKPSCTILCLFFGFMHHVQLGRMSTCTSPHGLWRRSEG